MTTKYARILNIHFPTSEIINPGWAITEESPEGTGAGGSGTFQPGKVQGRRAAVGSLPPPTPRLPGILGTRWVRRRRLPRQRPGSAPQRSGRPRAPNGGHFGGPAALRCRPAGERAPLCFGLLRFGLVCFGLVWFGLIWFSLVWLGLVQFGSIWFGWFCWFFKLLF